MVLIGNFSSALWPLGYGATVGLCSVSHSQHLPTSAGNYCVKLSWGWGCVISMLMTLLSSLDPLRSQGLSEHSHETVWVQTSWNLILAGWRCCWSALNPLWHMNEYQSSPALKVQLCNFSHGPWAPPRISGRQLPFISLDRFTSIAACFHRTEWPHNFSHALVIYTLD